MKYLVSGATGFIGSELVKQLLESGNEVTSLVRDESAANPRSQIIVGDLTSKNLQFSQNYDTTYHLAALTPLEKNKKLLRKVNYDGTKNLFNAVKEKTNSFVYISGLAIFDSANVITENTSKNPDIEFVKIRIEAEEFLKQNCKDAGIDFTVAYLGDMVYGNGGIFRTMFIDRLQKGSFRIPGNGNYFKNFIHLEDAVGSLITIATKNATNTSYVITDSNPVTLKEFVNFAAEQLGVKLPGTVPLFLAKIALGNDLIKLLTRSMKASNEKIRKIYEFKYPSYKEGVHSVISELNHNEKKNV